MSTWISFEHEGPDAQLLTLAHALTEASATLRETEDPGGGLHRGRLRPVVANLLPVDIAPAAGFASSELDFFVPSVSAAISVQAGRAWTNNGALLAVLAAAANRNVAWLLMVVPRTYKGAVQYESIRRQLDGLAIVAGVTLALSGVHLSSY